MIQVKKNKIFTDSDTLTKLKAQSSATVHEVLDKRNALVNTIKPLAKGMKVCGSALTVKAQAGDNLMIIKAISMLEKDQVLVVDSSGDLDFGPFGEVLAVEAKAKGAAGLIIDGSVRDSEAIIDLDFPVFSAGVSIRGTSKSAVGLINHDISCGGVVVRAGDLILGDDDGVVVIPYAKAKEVIEKAIKRDESERLTMYRLRNGESLFDVYGYQSVFDKLNIIEEE